VSSEESTSGARDAELATLDWLDTAPIGPFWESSVRTAYSLRSF
jgi:hypothetical protein